MSANPHVFTTDAIDRLLATIPEFSVAGFGTKGRSGNVKTAGYRCPTCGTKMDLRASGGVKSRCPNGHKGHDVRAIYRPVGYSCPPDCALLGDGTRKGHAGCYALTGHVAKHSERALADRFDPYIYLTELPTGCKVRLDVSGDKVGPDGAEYRLAIRLAMVARPDLDAWSYCHAWMDPEVAAWHATLPANCRIVASLDDPADADRARALGWTTVASVTATSDGETFTDAEARAVRRSGGFPCPAQRRNGQTDKRGKHLTIAFGCADGMCCSKPGRHIVFAAHGAGSSRAVSALASRRLQVL